MNIQEANILALVIQAKAIEVEVISMQANDNTEGSKYTEQSYLDKANALYAISGEIQLLARSGVFS